MSQTSNTFCRRKEIQGIKYANNIYQIYENIHLQTKYLHEGTLFKERLLLGGVTFAFVVKVG